MKKLATASLLGLAICAPAAMADTVLGLYAGAGVIDFNTSGTLTDLKSPSPQSAYEVNFKNDLGIKGDNGQYYYIAIEHGIPVLPNIKLTRTEYSEDATGTLTHNISIDGQLFPQGSNVKTNLDLSHTDLTFYYEILDNWVNLDLGLTARKFDGGIKVHGSYTYLSNVYSVDANQDLGFTMPLIYGRAEIDLPLTGLYVAGEGNWIGYSGSHFYDVWAKVGYTFSFGLGVEAGYRRIQLTVDNMKDINADATLSGNYIAATYHF